jgi:hypothetical protein
MSPAAAAAAVAVDHMNMGSLRAELMMPQCLALGEDEDEDELEAEMAIMGQGPGSFTKRSPHLAGRRLAVTIACYRILSVTIFAVLMRLTTRQERAALAIGPVLAADVAACVCAVCVVSCRQHAPATSAAAVRCCRCVGVAHLASPGR